MRGLRPLLAVVALAASILLLGARPAAACSCAAGSDAEHLAWSEAVVVGVVRSVEPRAQAPTTTTTSPGGGVSVGPDDVVWTVDVERVYKGDAVSVEHILASGPSSSCGGSPPGPGRALLFLTDLRKYENPTWDGSERWTSGLCSGNRLVEPEGVPASYGKGAPPSAEAATTTSTEAPSTTVAAPTTTSADGGSDVTIAGAEPSGSTEDSGLRGAAGVGVGLAVGGAAALILRRRRRTRTDDLEPEDGAP